MNEFKIFSATQFTSLSDIPSLDVMARISRSSPSSAPAIATMETQEFFSRLLQLRHEWSSDVNALNELINWQHKLIDFNATYAAFLLEQIDEEEFDRVAEEMATDERDLLPEDIAPIMARLLRLTRLDFTPSDFANLFHCSPSVIDEALHMIPRALTENHPQLKEAEE